MKKCEHIWRYEEKMWGMNHVCACRCVRCGKFGFLKYGQVYTWDQPYAVPVGF